MEKGNKSGAEFLRQKAEELLKKKSAAERGKLSEVDTTETAKVIKTLMAEDRNLDPIFQALVLEAMNRC